MNLHFKLNKKRFYIIICFLFPFILVLPALAQDIQYLDFLKSVDKNLLEQKAVHARSNYGSEEESFHYILNTLFHDFKLKPDYQRKSLQAKEIKEIKEIIISIIKGKKVT